MSEDGTQAKTRRFKSPMFLLTAAVMSVMGIGVPPALNTLRAHYSKESIAIPTSLHTFDPTTLPSYRHSAGASLPHVDPRAVGTEEYYTAGFRPNEARYDSGDLILLVTYYSDPEDTVPHTPEVCYRQTGSIIDAISSTDIAFGDLGVAPARVLDITQGSIEVLVVYVFIHNGKLFHDREQVRLAMGVPGDKYTYFTKVEVACEVRDRNNRALAIETAGGLLAEVVAELRADYLPQDEALR